MRRYISDEFGEFLLVRRVMPKTIEVVISDIRTDKVTIHPRMPKTDVSAYLKAGEFKFFESVQ